MLEKLSAWKSINKYIPNILKCFSWHSVHLVIWFWQLNSATDTSKCHYSALTFQNFQGEIPRTLRNNVAPSTLVGHNFAVSDRNPTITATHTNCLLTHHFNLATPLPGNAFSPYGIKTLPEPVITNDRWNPMAVTWGIFCRKCPRKFDRKWRQSPLLFDVFTWQSDMDAGRQLPRTWHNLWHFFS